MPGCCSWFGCGEYEAIMVIVAGGCLRLDGLGGGDSAVVCI